MIIPCIKEDRWGRHKAQDSIVLSMLNNLLCSGAQHDTHTLSALSTVLVAETGGGEGDKGNMEG